MQPKIKPKIMIPMQEREREREREDQRITFFDVWLCIYGTIDASHPKTKKQKKKKIVKIRGIENRDLEREK